MLRASISISDCLRPVWVNALKSRNLNDVKGSAGSPYDSCLNGGLVGKNTSRQLKLSTILVIDRAEKHSFNACRAKLGQSRLIRTHPVQVYTSMCVSTDMCSR